jgi:signal transduction histidine kinase
VLVLTLFVESDLDVASGFAIRPLGELAVAGYFIAIADSAALIWRRQSPLWSYGSIVVLGAVSALLGSPDAYYFPIAVYSLGRYETDERWSAVGGGVAVTFGLAAALIEGETLPDTVGGVIFVFVLWYIGRRIRVRRTYLTVLQEHAARLERDRAAEARQAVTEERTRIARELHDVVAHKVSLMMVQGGAAKTAAGDDPQAAVEAMEAAEQAGRQALDELRHLLGVLRPAADADKLGPQSGLDDLPVLIKQFESPQTARTSSFSTILANIQAMPAMAPS